MSGRQIAALYVYADGPYAGLPGVDLWDAKRDARLYQGPHPSSRTRRARDGADSRAS